MSSLRINFVPNNPPQGKIQNIRKEPFAQLPPNYVRPSTLGMNTNFKVKTPTILSIISVTQSGIIINFSDGQHARSHNITIYSSTSSLMTSPTFVLRQTSVKSGNLVSFTPSNGLYYGVALTAANHFSEATTTISTGILYTETAAAPPTAPTVVTVTAISSTSATITWSGDTLATSYTVNIYYNSSSSVTTSNLQVAQSPYTSVTSGSTFSFTATDARYYAATVTAINSSGEETSTISAALGYFLAPGQATVNTPTNTGTTLNMEWNAPLLGGASITSYTVYVLAGGSLAPSGTLSPGLVTSTTFSPMVSGTAYSFYVVANGNGGSGTQSSTSSTVTYYTPPGQASTNTPTNTSTTLNITWTAPASGGVVTGYTVYVLAGGSLAPSGTLTPGLVTSTTFSPMVSGTAYSFYVVATGPGGSATQSTTSSTVTYYTPPGQATVNTPTNTSTTLNMTWTAPASGGTVTGYTVYVLAGGSLAPSGTLTPGLVTSTTFSPMVSGTAYSFYVVATGPGGSGTQSTTSSTVTYTSVPVAPTSITFSSITGTGATVTWSGGSGATSYTCQIYSSASSNMSSSSTVVQSPTSSTSVTSPQAFTFTATDGLYYGAIITAINTGGSTASSMSTGVLYTAVPVAPTSITVSSLTGTGATVTWSGGSGASSYTVQIYSSASSNMSSPSTVVQSPTSSTSVTSPQAFTFTATNALYYGAIVTAVNAGGSTASSMSTGLLYTAPPVAPTTVTLSSLTGSGATVTWSGGSGASSYTVQIYSSSSSNMSSPSTVSQTPSSSTSVTSPQAFTFTSTDALYYGAIVTAVNTAGSTASSMSTGVLYTLPPVAPTSVTLASLTGTGASVSWSGGSGASSYTVQIYSSASSNMSSPSTVSHTPLSSASVTSPQAFTFTATGSLYYGAIVTAVNAGGSTASSMSSGVLYAISPPTAPTSLTLSSLTGTGASVSWSGGSGAITYTVQIYSSSSSDMSSPSTVSQSPSSSTTVTSPQAFLFTATVSLYYGAIVTAVNSGGSTASSMSTGVLYDSSPLSAPTTVTIVSVTVSGVTVTWSGDTGATSYTCQIYYSITSDMSSPTTISQSPNSSTSVSPWQLFTISVQDGLYYAAIVTAVNSGGSLASSISSGMQFNNVYSGTTSVSTVANSGFGALYGLAIDSSENIYLADYGGHKIWYIPSGGSPSILAGSTSGLVNGDVSIAKFNGPSGVAISPDGSTIYISDYGNSKIRKITGGIVTTLAGGTHGAWLDGASNVARFYYPSGIAIDRTGTVLFIGDKLTHRIRVVTIATGAVSTLAGGANSTVAGAGSYADGNGANASFNSPLGLCVDLNNNIYVADQANHRIRKVTYPGGDVTTVAGSGVSGFSNAVGLTARFSNPYGVGMDSYGILYVADKDNRRIRRITGAAAVTPSVASAAVVTTFAGSGVNSAVDNANALLATFTQPTGVIVNSSGNALYLTHVVTSAVRKITLNSYTVVPVAPTIVSIVSLIATGATVSWSGGSGALSYTVQIYSSSSSNMSSPSTVSQTPISGISFTSPQAFTFTAVDNLYYGAIVTAVNTIGSTESLMSTSFLYRIPVAPTSIILSPLIGTGASISWSGDSGAITYTVQIYSSSSSDMSSPSTVSQTPSSSASITSPPQLFTFTATNSLYYGAIVTTVNRSGSSVSSMSSGVLYTGSSSALAPTTVTITSLTLSSATATWSGSSGADSYTCQIYSSTASNMSSPTIVSQSPIASTSVSSGQVFNIVPQDSLYYAAIVTAISASGSESSISTGVQFSGVYTGTLQLGQYSSSASFGTPRGMAFDSNGNLYVVDAVGRKVWVIPPGGGDPSIFAGPSASTTGYIDANGSNALFNELSGVAIDSNNNLYVTDYGNCCIRKITPSGDVSTFTGSASTSGQNGVGAGGYVDGPSNVAEFWYPYGIVTDTSKSVLFVSEFNTHRIRVVSLADGSVTTLAGGYLSVVNSRSPDYWNDGTGSAASFASPQGMCVDQFNNIYVADTENNRIRKVTYPGGVVTTIAGNTAAAFANGTGSDARFNSPCGVAVDANGVLYVADRGNNRIRQITGAGVVTSFAGSGTSGTTNNANPLLATYANIGGILIDSQRTIYISHAGSGGAINKGIRKITMA